MGLAGLSEPRNLHRLNMVKLSLGTARWEDVRKEGGSLKAKSEQNTKEAKLEMQT